MSCTFVPATGGCSGTLAQAPLLGGAPRPLAQNVLAADWGPDDRLAAIVGGRLEYPLGTPVAEQADHVRVSPDGQRLAWAEARASRYALIVREDGSNRVLSDGWGAIRGIAWAGDGKSVFLTGQAPDGSAKDVLRIGLDGSVHLVLRASAGIRVLDAAANQLLVVQEKSSCRALLKSGEGSQPRDLSWLGSGTVDALSDDARLMLMTVRGGPTLRSRRAGTSARAHGPTDATRRSHSRAAVDQNIQSVVSGLA
jgi:eukaryotic-like serine/threonine-protein kinase